jgi:hypothetical protein
MAAPAVSWIWRSASPGRVHVLHSLVGSFLEALGHATAVAYTGVEDRATDEAVDEGALARPRVPQEEIVLDCGHRCRHGYRWVEVVLVLIGACRHGVGGARNSDCEMRSEQLHGGAQDGIPRRCGCSESGSFTHAWVQDK